MSLYDVFETETSYDYLKKVAKVLEEPICLLGGWAVYLTVNNNFKREQGRSYLGSKDIDIGFHIEKNFSETDLKKTAFGISIKALEKEGFQAQGFRYYKNIHRETGEELTPDKSKSENQFDIFQIYVDLIVDYIHPLSKDIFNFVPIDELLLHYVFKEEKYRKEIELKKFKRKLWLSSPEILLAMKIKSAPNRIKDDKLIKDICDIYALSWYSGEEFDKVIYSPP